MINLYYRYSDANNRQNKFKLASKKCHIFTHSEQSLNAKHSVVRYLLPFQYWTGPVCRLLLYSVRSSNHHLNTGPSHNRTQIYYFNTGLFQYLESFCTLLTFVTDCRAPSLTRGSWRRIRRLKLRSSSNLTDCPSARCTTPSTSCPPSISCTQTRQKRLSFRGRRENNGLCWNIDTTLTIQIPNTCVKYWFLQNNWNKHRFYNGLQWASEYQTSSEKRLDAEWSGFQMPFEYWTAQPFE